MNPKRKSGTGKEKTQSTYWRPSLLCSFCEGANGISASCWPFVTTTNTIWSPLQKINQGWPCLTSQTCHRLSAEQSQWVINPMSRCSLNIPLENDKPPLSPMEAGTRVKDELTLSTCTFNTQTFNRPLTVAPGNLYRIYMPHVEVILIKKNVSWELVCLVIYSIKCFLHRSHSVLLLLLTVQISRNKYCFLNQKSFL